MNPSKDDIKFIKRYFTRIGFRNSEPEVSQHMVIVGVGNKSFEVICSSENDAVNKRIWIAEVIANICIQSQ